MTTTTLEIARATGYTARHINRVCRRLFGPGGWARHLNNDEQQRVVTFLARHGRKETSPQIRCMSAIAGTDG